MRVRTRTIVTLLATAGVMVGGSAFAACDSKDHRAFDFWLGQWQVRSADGKIAGDNKIEIIQSGCVLHEAYKTARGYTGESFNIYDASRKRWHQTWVDSDGALLILEGGVRDGKMILEGSTVDENGRATKQRITWTPNKNGTVRQLWESIDDKGVTTVAFDGLYTRR